jgi:integrase
VRPLSEDEVARLLAAARGERTLLLFLVRTGARPGEALALRWSDINFEKREATIARSISGLGVIGTTKTDTVRTVDLSLELVAALKALRVQNDRAALADGREASKIVFVNSKGGHTDISRVRKWFASAMKRAGLSGHRLYDLRHTFASTHLAKGHPITYVSAQLGHAKPTMTLHSYAKWLPRADRSFADALDSNSGERPGLANINARPILKAPASPLPGAPLVAVK